MHLLLAAASGWGKGYLAQALIDRNIRTDRFDRVVMLDTANEFRGLCSEEHGPAPADHWAVTDREAATLGPPEWREMVRQNDALVLQRAVPKGEEWREAAADIILGCRRADLDVLVVIDEGHGIAPQSEGYPKPVNDLATDGRSEGGSATSSAWLTQRPAQTDKDVVGNCTARFIGGFETSNDLGALADVLPYPKKMHASGGQPVGGNPSEELRTDDSEAISVRKWTEPDDSGEPQTVNSEWVFSDDTGKIARKQSNEYRQRCDHVGAAGKRIDVGV